MLLSENLRHVCVWLTITADFVMNCEMLSNGKAFNAWKDFDNLYRSATLQRWWVKVRLRLTWKVLETCASLLLRLVLANGLKPQGV